MTHAAAPGSRLTFAVASATSGALAHSQGCMDGPLARDQRSVTPQEVRERTASCCRLRRRHLDACHRGWVFRLERPLLPGHGGAQRLAVYGAGRGLSTTRGAACGGQSRPIHSRCLPCSRDRHVAGAVSRRNLRLLDPGRDPHQRGRRTRQVVDLDLDRTWILRTAERRVSTSSAWWGMPPDAAFREARSGTGLRAGPGVVVVLVRCGGRRRNAGADR